MKNTKQALFLSKVSARVCHISCLIKLAVTKARR